VIGFEHFDEMYFLHGFFEEKRSYFSNITYQRGLKQPQIYQHHELIFYSVVVWSFYLFDPVEEFLLRDPFKLIISLLRRTRNPSIPVEGEFPCLNLYR